MPTSPSDPDGEMLRPHAVPISLLAGLVLGAAAGLIGVGGGEFRIPVLLYLFRRNVRVAAAVNLVVGLFTVILSFIRRWGQTTWTPDQLELSAALAVASLIGALVGAVYAHRIPSRGLLRAVIGYLLIVGGWMIFESLSRTEAHLADPGGIARIGLALALGFAIATLSTSLGVAGGEMRIPALIYLFGLDVKVAGTLSLFASIPTVAGGAFTYRRLGHLTREPLRIALVMGSASLVGVMIGSALLPYADRHLLKGLLGLVLLLATAALLVPMLRRVRSDV